jgi:hypothetical protein
LLDDIGLAKAVLELLRYDEQLEKVPNWDLEKPLLLKVADTSQNPVGSFFRYCGTYMTPSRQTAAWYALFNDCGSEALACTLKILNAVLAQLPTLGVIVRAVWLDESGIVLRGLANSTCSSGSSQGKLATSLGEQASTYEDDGEGD